MSITLTEAKALKRGDMLVSVHTGKRWKVNGMVKTWKTDPTRIHVPLKHGLYAYDALEDRNFINGICHDVTKEAS
jgi:hypothetical protein